VQRDLLVAGLFIVVPLLHSGPERQDGKLPQKPKAKHNDQDVTVWRWPMTHYVSSDSKKSQKTKERTGATACSHENRFHTVKATNDAGQWRAAP
jgi:hypothetical protein